MFNYKQNKQVTRRVLVLNVMIIMCDPDCMLNRKDTCACLYLFVESCNTLGTLSHCMDWHLEPMHPPTLSHSLTDWYSEDPCGAHLLTSDFLSLASLLWHSEHRRLEL